MSDQQQPTGLVFTISGADLLERFDKLTEKVGELAAKFDSVPHRLDDLSGDVRDHETRLRGLERRLWMMAGGATVVAALISWALQQMGHA